MIWLEQNIFERKISADENFVVCFLVVKELKRLFVIWLLNMFSLLRKLSKKIKNYLVRLILIFLSFYGKILLDNLISMVFTLVQFQIFKHVLKRMGIGI